MNHFRTGFLMLSLLATGCSTFQSDWKTLVSQPVRTASIEGCWDGTWKSDVNGHTGRLRCILTKQAAGTYQARFHAQYNQILSFGYTVTLTGQATGTTFTFNGEANLGWWAGGRYQYAGEISPTNFFSTYECRYDHGIFQMYRPTESRHE